MEKKVLYCWSLVCPEKKKWDMRNVSDMLAPKKTPKCPRDKPTSASEIEFKTRLMIKLKIELKISLRVDLRMKNPLMRNGY